MYIYVASSWRNRTHRLVVDALRTGHHHYVYDFKNGETSFGWSEIDPQHRAWTSLAFRDALETPLAERGFHGDMAALRECDVCVLVLPCGRSSHLELGWAVGAGKKTAILLDPEPEPELMYKMVDKLCVNVRELREWVDKLADEKRANA